MPASSPLAIHVLEIVVGNFERDVQIEIVLLLERESFPSSPGASKKARHEPSFICIEGMQHAVSRPVFVCADLEALHQRQAEEVLVELPRLLGIAAAIGVVMQSLDHLDQTVSNCWPFSEPGEAIHDFVDLVPAGSFFIVPSQRWTLGIVLERTADQLASRQDAAAEIVGDR